MSHLRDSPDTEDEKFNQGTIILNTDVGRLKASWECCQPRSHDVGIPYSDVRVAKCLGVPYANIPYRWAAPRESEPWQDIKGCTSFGPQCPQAKDILFDIEDLPVFGPLSKDSYYIQGETENEFDCLNLNIFAPLNTACEGRLAKSKLPVLVWVHGGACWTGTGGVDIYDGSEIVARSVRIGAPVIVVTFNYRLGVLGWLHSKQLAHEASQQEVPPHFQSTANLGLLDTLMAFNWVKNHISSFGGDPDNITGIGESSGAVSLNLLSLFPHLNIKIRRMFLSSSTVFSNHMLLGSESQTWFDAICKKNGIPQGSPTCVSDLRRIPVEDLISNSHFARGAFRPIWDDITITYDPRRVMNEPDLWDHELEEVVLGQCANESWVRLACLSSLSPDIPGTIDGRIPPAGHLRDRALKLYSPTRAPQYQWFNDSTAATLPDTAVSWLALESHARYYAVTQLLSDSFLASGASSVHRRKLFKYIFSWTPSQWPKGWPATHTADILPMFLPKRLPYVDLAVSQTFTDQMILFTAGLADQLRWQRFERERKVFNVLGRDGNWGIMEEGSGEFGLDADTIEFWRDAINASLETGRDGWIGIRK